MFSLKNLKYFGLKKKDFPIPKSKDSFNIDNQIDFKEAIKVLAFFSK